MSTSVQSSYTNFFTNNFLGIKRKHIKKTISIKFHHRIERQIYKNKEYWKYCIFNIK